MFPALTLVSYRINRQLSGWNLPPLMIRAFGAHGQKETFEGLLLFGSWRFGLQIDDETANAHSEPSQWVLQCHDCGRPENA
jgi:hypothetical protein